MQYNPALDGLRAVAVLTVVFFHLGVTGFGGGFVGLDLFFVLSGYLITSLLAVEHRAGGIHAGRFYARRALRLYPSLLLMLAAYLALAPIFWPQDDAWWSAARAASYVMDYAMAFWNVSWTVGHTWSLGVEEKFYLLWPFALPLLLRSRRPVGWLLAAFFAVTAWRYFVGMNFDWRQAYFSFDTRMSGILLGAIAALARFKVSRTTLVIACIAFAVNAMVPSLPNFGQPRASTLGITLAELAAFVLVCHAARHRDSPLLASPPMVYIGRLSYGIYLWHFPAWVALRFQPWWITALATIAFSTTMAAICLHLVDMPLRRWRARRAAAPVGAAAAGPLSHLQARDLPAP